MSTSKIFNIGADLNEQEITNLIRANFNEGIRVTLPMVLKWSTTNTEVCSFFMIFKMLGPEHVIVKTLTDNEIITYEQYMKKHEKLEEERKEQ